MKLNRREFIASTAAAVTSLQTAQLSARQGRKLFITYHGLSIVTIERTSGTGIPATAPRVDVLFVKNAAHNPPLLFGNGGSLSLENADLRISVGGKPLGTGSVALTRGPAAVCPGNALEWSNLNRIPEFDSILNEPVTVAKSALAATNPTGVSGRVSMRNGSLTGELPVNAYDGAQWNFPQGNPKYVRAFTDTLLWMVDIGASGNVTFEALKFDGSANPAPLVVSSAGDLQMMIEAQRINRVPPSSPETQITHFAHYYDLLDYKSKTAASPKPIPTRTAASCAFIQLTGEEQQRFNNNFELRVKFLKREENEDCGGDTMRAEPGICMSGVAYSDFK